LLRLLAGLSPAAKGQYFFDGESVDAASLKKAAFSNRLHQRIGLVFQNPEVMLFNHSVAAEIAFGPLQLRLSEQEVESRVSDMLRLFGLEQLRERPPYALSGGEKHRTALAAVLAMNPEVLLLDEPYTGLDEETAALLTRILQQLHQAGKTILAATHDASVVGKICTRQITLNSSHQIVEDRKL
jgi:cobalt/nickel transport system ATP-binding protein